MADIEDVITKFSRQIVRFTALEIGGMIRADILRSHKQWLESLEPDERRIFEDWARVNLLRRG